MLFVAGWFDQRDSDRYRAGLGSNLSFQLL